MKAGKTLEYNGKVYLTTLNLVQIFSAVISCKGCYFHSVAEICPINSDGLLCGGHIGTPVDEQIIFVEAETHESRKDT